MYENVKYQGKTLREWCEALHNKFTIGELYRMSKDKVDFTKL